ncbi:hypothetical protein NXX40_25955 (plasmid) [Parabacteroides distasonis]|nr:hypothetical protein [Parabacteroides distasonis]
MEPNKLIKDKNKLLMAIPVILGILFLYVFFIRENGNGMSGSDKQAASQAFLEPQSEMADKVNDKMEAYKQDKPEEQEKARILKESQVKGSDFYFELQNQQERYDRATLGAHPPYAERSVQRSHGRIRRWPERTLLSSAGKPTGWIGGRAGAQRDYPGSQEELTHP